MNPGTGKVQNGPNCIYFLMKPFMESVEIYLSIQKLDAVVGLVRTARLETITSSRKATSLHKSRGIAEIVFVIVNRLQG